MEKQRGNYNEVTGKNQSITMGREELFPFTTELFSTIWRTH